MSYKLDSLENPSRLSNISELIGVKTEIKDQSDLFCALQNIDENKYLSGKGKEELKLEFRKKMEESIRKYITENGDKCKFYRIMTIARTVNGPHASLVYLKIALDKADNLGDLSYLLEYCQRLKEVPKSDKQLRENLEELIGDTNVRIKDMEKELEEEFR